MKIKYVFGVVTVISVVYCIIKMVNNNSKADKKQNIKELQKEKSVDLNSDCAEVVTGKSVEGSYSETKQRVYDNMSKRNEMANQILQEVHSEMKTAKEDIEQKKEDIEKIMKDLQR